jgi:hypothetical protein
MTGFLSSRELAQTNPAERAAFCSPVPTRMISNGEFNPLPQTPLGRRNWSTCAFSKPYPLENYAIPGLSDILKFMTGWVLQWLSAAWTRLGQRRDLLLEFIVLRHQLAVLQRTGRRRPCFRPE